MSQRVNNGSCSATGPSLSLFLSFSLLASCSLQATSTQYIRIPKRKNLYRILISTLSSSATTIGWKIRKVRMERYNEWISLK